MIIVEAATVNSARKFYPNTLGLFDDSLIDGWKKLSERIHKHGAKMATQILDPGPNSGRVFGGISVGPSPVWARDIRETPQELSIREIMDIINDYVMAATRAKEAGLDAIEIHAAHSYSLIGSFLSSIFNKRTDEYGGHLHQRAKLLMDILKAIKEKLGKDFPIIVRISGDDRIPGGRTIQETQFLAPLIAEAGADAIEISSGAVPEAFWAVVPPAGTPQAMNADLAESVKKVVGIPVISVGRINTPQIAEFILKTGKADMVSMGRALIADPDMPLKAEAGKFEDIVPCVGDNEGCLIGHPERGTVSCTMNPSRCREKQSFIKPAKKKKRIMVIGGGPAGLEASRVASIRGHEVLLFEKEAKLGGQMNLACIPPFKQELSLMIQYLQCQVEKQGISISLNKKVDLNLIEEVKPDAAIIATGAEPLIPEDIPGIDNDIVVTAWDVLGGKAAMKAKNVIIIGGGSVGCETADFLSDYSNNDLSPATKVILVEMMDKVAMDMGLQPRQLLMQRLMHKKVNILTSTSVKEIQNDSVVIIQNQKEKIIQGIDQVVLALGSKPVERLSETAKKKIKEVYIIGDAKKPGRAILAIDQGRETGRLL